MDLRQADIFLHQQAFGNFQTLLRRSGTRTFGIAAFVTIASATVFLLTATPTFTFGDSGEFIAASATLGIAHPAGFPVFLLLTKLWSMLWGDPIHGAIAFAAVCGAVTAGMLSWLVWMLTKNRWYAALLPFVAVFFSVYWQQATMSEVYTLNSVFAIAALCCFVRWQHTTSQRWLALAWLIFGLGVATHIMHALLFPGYILFVLLTRDVTLRKWKTWALMAGMAALGMTFYLYLPIRSAAHPPVSWAPINSIGSFVHHLTRADYRSDSAPILHANAQGQQFGIRDINQYAATFLEEARQMFGYVLLTLALFGLTVLVRKQRAIGIMLFSSIVVPPLLVVVGGRYPVNAEWIAQMQVVFLHSLLPLVAAAAIGCVAFQQWLVRMSARYHVRSGVATLFVVGLVALTVYTHLLGNLRMENRRHEDFLSRYWHQAFTEIAPNGVLALRGAGDGAVFSNLVLQYIEKERPDITVVSDTPYHTLHSGNNHIAVSPTHIEGTHADRIFMNLIVHSTVLAGRPLYSVEPFTHTGIVTTRSVGLLYQVFRSNDELQRFQIPNTFPPLTSVLTAFPQRDFSTDESALVSSYYYARSLWLTEQGRKQSSGQALALAIAYDPQPFSPAYYKYLSARQEITNTRGVQ